VRVFSIQNLHAKVFVCGRKAFIGSANVSRHSAGILKEAVVETTEPKAVKAARDFVIRLSLQELGLEELKRLIKIYRQPVFFGEKKSQRRTVSAARVRPKLTGLRLAHLEIGHHPSGSESALESGRKVARSKRKYRRTHFLDEFEWPRASIRAGETVVQLVSESNGAEFVTAPGNVISTRKWKHGKRQCTFVYLEVPKRKRIRTDKLARRLGRGAIKKLRRSGSVSEELAEKLRREFV